MNEVNDARRGGKARPGYRAIPSIEQLLQRPAVRALEQRYGHQAIVDALRDEADRLRSRLAAGDGADLPADAASAGEYLQQRIQARLPELFAGSLHRVVNATGVIIHTNLGRAPLSEEAVRKLAEVARGYSNLEFDLATGRRGRRDAHAAELLCRLTGAESAVVVNNNAAATLLVLAALASGREVIVSRGELVEIGGGFRVPEVMAQSGAVLREVGTTNKTRIGDYEAAVTDRTALILRVHRSNFRIEGFTEQPSLEDLVSLGRRLNLPVVHDLGSGWLGGVAPLADRLPDEPTVRASIAAGIDVTCFSGDKLLGGPQAGLLVGREAPIGRCRRHPLMRALRVDKLTYAALEGTLLGYLAGRVETSIPVARMLAMPAEAIEKRARALADAVGCSVRFDVQMRDAESMVGGGSAPGVPIPTRVLALCPKAGDATGLEAALRACDPPVIGRVEQDCVLLDLRTVLPEEDELLVNALRAVDRA